MSNLFTGLFKSSQVLTTYDGRCDLLTATVTKVEENKIYYQRSTSPKNKKPYFGVEFSVVDQDTLKAVYSSSKCLLNLGGHLGCAIYGGMEISWTDVFVRDQE